MLLTVALLAILAGCTSRPPVAHSAAPYSVGIVGVVLAPGVESGKSQTAMASELQQLVQSSGRFMILRSKDIANAVDSVASGTYRKMLKGYAERGQLGLADIQALNAAQLPVQTVLIARVEKNEVGVGPTKRVQLRNNAGQIMTDRERVVLSTVREMQLQASLINLASGKLVWSRTYRATPAAESSYIHYSGSSFSGSLAASFANTMSNGLRVPTGPASPSHHLTLQSLMREVVRNLPRR